MGLRNYIIDGVSCAGKTTVGRELQRRGYQVIHGDDELAYWGESETEPRTWMWNVAKVRALVADKTQGVTFFCGGSRNSDSFIDLMDGAFVLEIDRDTLNRRLAGRPADEWGGTATEGEAFARRQWETGEGLPRNAARIDAARPVADLADAVLESLPLHLVNLKAPHWLHRAAVLLSETFNEIGKFAWPTLEEAAEEVDDCVKEPKLALGAVEGGDLVGWIGMQPLYDHVWELHPLVVKSGFRKKGVGRFLMAALEQRARERGLLGLVLGADDMTFSTSLSQGRLTPENLFREIAGISSKKGHPYQFYQKLGYSIIGVIPDANGRGMPDIWMWKDLG